MDNEIKKISEEIVDQIKDLIIQKRYLPGDKLPNERKLSDDMGVSRTALREALKILAAAGVLEIKRGVGTFVAKEPGVSKDPLGLEFIGENHQLLKHWYDVRLILEPEAVYLATLRATDDEIEKIIKLESDVLEQVKNDEDFLYEDLEFHTELAKATHNPILERLIPLIYKSSNMDITSHRSDKWFERARKNAAESHREIIRFLKARDAEGARLAARYHLIRAIKDIDMEE